MGGGCHGEEGEAVIILGASRLYGPQVAMAAHAEATGQVQGLHSLRLHLPKNRLAHSLKLVVQLIINLERGKESGPVKEGAQLSALLFIGVKKPLTCSKAAVHTPMGPDLIFDGYIQ